MRSEEDKVQNKPRTLTFKGMRGQSEPLKGTQKELRFDSKEERCTGETKGGRDSQQIRLLREDKHGRKGSVSLSNPRGPPGRAHSLGSAKEKPDWRGCGK